MIRTYCLDNKKDWGEGINLLLFAVRSRVLRRGHGGRVVTLSHPTSEARVWFPAQSQVGKLVVACRWLAVYSTES